MQVSRILRRALTQLGEITEQPAGERPTSDAEQRDSRWIHCTGNPGLGSAEGLVNLRLGKARMV
jgi:hypothetical protein